MTTSISTLTSFEFGRFRLDGGSMFGSVPKTLWSRKIQADVDNCIQLTTRSLLIRYDRRVILVDTGLGDLWSDKQRKIFAIENNHKDNLPFKAEDITDVVLTHLHFDHAGGVCSADSSGSPYLTYPQATVYLQRSNWENALNPTVKEKASYLEKFIRPLATTKLSLVEGSTEIVPGLKVHRVDGHTVGQQWLEIDYAGRKYFFATDVIPTAHHIPLAYHMGYDTCATTLLREKDELLKRAVNEGAILIFEHDWETTAAKIRIDDGDAYSIGEVVAI